MKAIRIVAVIIAMGYATSLPAADTNKTDTKQSKTKKDSTTKTDSKKKKTEAESTRERKSDDGPNVRSVDPLHPDPTRPGTPPTFPPRNEASPKTPVKPTDPTAPTIVK
jgi:hypothetical protein